MPCGLPEPPPGALWRGVGLGGWLHVQVGLRDAIADYGNVNAVERSTGDSQRIVPDISINIADLVGWRSVLICEVGRRAAASHCLDPAHPLRKLMGLL